ncbi:MAG: hypothetical protein FJ304_02250 [Planctomycetes bacterium]|nr:hypothetical protein [Planctomycetota bacterium]
MTYLEEITLRSYRDAQEHCAEALDGMIGPPEVVFADGPWVSPALTDDLIFQCAEPGEPEGWGWFLSAEDHSHELLNCEPFSAEWEPRPRLCNARTGCNGSRRGVTIADILLRRQQCPQTGQALERGRMTW